MSETDTERGPAPVAATGPVRDAQLIIVARGLRSFAYGLLAVILGFALSRDGLAPSAIGVLITVSLAGDFCATYVVSLGADYWGRRRTLLVLALLMAATGLVFGLTRAYAVLLVAAFFGTLGTSASETAPFLPLEQAILSTTTSPARCTALFARYNLVASFGGAIGALTAGLPDLLVRVGLPVDTGLRLMFGVYALVAVAVALLVTRLSSRVEIPSQTPGAALSGRRRLAPPLGRSRGLVLRLAALFSVDALAGGLVVQSLMVLFWCRWVGVRCSILWAD